MSNSFIAWLVLDTACRSHWPAWASGAWHWCGIAATSLQLMALRALSGSVPIDVLMNLDDAVYALLSIGSAAGLS